MKKIAVIDIGSNSVRYMSTFNAEKVNEKQLNSTALGKGLSITGKLNTDAMARSANAVCAFVDIANKENADIIYIFATEAVRAATNGAEFVKLIKQKTGIDVDVITGSLEAKIGFMGSAPSFAKTCGIVDIGGASVEIISGKGENITYEKSLPLGMIRIIDNVGNRRDKVRAYICENIGSYGTVPLCDEIIGIGGTATSIGSMVLNQKVYDCAYVHDSCVLLKDLNNLEDAIFGISDGLNLPSPDKIIEKFPILGANRAALIGNGIIMMTEILKYLNKQYFTVSEKDNMEGYILYKGTLK